MTKIFDFRDHDINDLNYKIWSAAYYGGDPLTFGDPAEIKKARYIYATTVFEGATLDAVNRGVMPDGWDFKGKCVKDYGNQFYNREMWKDFEYTYAQRLLSYVIPNPKYPKTALGMLFFVISHLKIPSPTVTINQLEHMRNQLQMAFDTGIQSTRIVAITFQPHLDYGKSDIPCLQCIQILPLPGKMAEIHYLFRSHDLGNGIMANMHQLNNALLRHVIVPAGGSLKRVIVTSWVGHLYETDMSMVEKTLNTVTGRWECQQ